MRLAAFALFLLALTATARPTADPTTEEQKVIAAVVKLGGKAEIDPKLHAEARVVARFETATDKLLDTLKKQPLVGAVEIFDATKCTAKGFTALKSLPQLRKFVVGKANLNMAAITALGQCKELRYLALVQCGLTDLELAGLMNLTLLEHLSLSNNPKITDKGMAVVKTLDRLQALYLSNTSITDQGLAELKVLDGLRSLNVTNTKVTADAADRFTDDMPNLRVVRR